MTIDMEDGASILRLPPRFAGPLVKQAHQLFHEALGAGLKSLVVDLGETTSVDSFGIGVLVSFAKELKSRHGELSVRNLAGDVKELFEMSGVDQLFAVEARDGSRSASFDFSATSVDITLEIQEREEGEVYVMGLRGSMSHPQGALHFRNRLLLAMARSKKILIDMNDFFFIDSVSVGVIVSMHSLMTGTGGSIRICNANFLVQDLFRGLGLEKVIDFYDLKRQALEGWA